MHTCSPPINELKKWLKSYPTVYGDYGHLLLEQECECEQPLLDGLRQYFESAHFDAREYFHAAIGIDLHPDAEDRGNHACYPNCLPDTARRGLFGEVMAGLITESYQFIGKHKWVIPVFLFRYHADAEKYLYDLARNKKKTRAVFGRFGSDFIGLSLGKDGEVVRFIAGEAKWRNRLNDSVIDELFLGKWKKTQRKGAQGERVRTGGIWHNINTDTPIPHGIRQLQRLLQECDPNRYSAAIVSIDKALLLNNPKPIPRTDLILIVGNVDSDREEGVPFMPWEATPKEYTAGNNLQVVEVFLHEGELLIDAIYDSLWAEGDSDASE